MLNKITLSMSAYKCQYMNVCAWSFTTIGCTFIIFSLKLYRKVGTHSNHFLQLLWLCFGLHLRWGGGCLLHFTSVHLLSWFLIQFTFFMNVEVHAWSFATHWSTFVIFSLRPYRKAKGHSNHFLPLLWLCFGLTS